MLKLRGILEIQNLFHKLANCGLKLSDLSKQRAANKLKARFFLDSIYKIISMDTKPRIIQYSRSVVWATFSDLMDCSTPGFHVHHQLLGACSNSCPSSWRYHLTISSSVIPFSTCLQSFPASGSFPMSQFFTSGVQSFTPVLPMNIQGWFPLGLNVLISFPSKGLSRVFSSTTI